MKIKDKLQSDKQTALLTLAGKTPPGRDNCPDSEELACLLEGKIAEEERKRLLSHISSCEHCYQEWLALSQLTMKQKGAGKILLFTRRNMAWTGSILAAAASIVVFLNITLSPDFKDHTPQQSPLPEKQDIMEMELAETKKGIPSPIKTVESSIISEPDTINLQGREERSLPPSPAFKITKKALLLDESSKAPSEKKISPIDKQTGRQRAQSATHMMARAMPEDITLQEWYKLLGKACKAKEESQFFWQEKLDQGRSHFPVLLDQQPKLSSLLQALADDGKERDGQCKKLLLLLAELEKEMLD